MKINKWWGLLIGLLIGLSFNIIYYLYLGEWDYKKIPNWLNMVDLLILIVSFAYGWYLEVERKKNKII